MRNHAGLCLLAVMIAAGALSAAQPLCRVKQVPDPLNGRLLVISNEAVEITVAPQIGGRILGLRLAGGPELLGGKAEYSQARDAVSYAGGRWVSAVQTPAEAEVLAEHPDLAAVQWRTVVRDEGAALSVTRRAVVTAGAPAAFMEVVVRNAGDQAARGVQYHLSLPFEVTDDVALSALDKSLSLRRDELRDKKLARSLPAGVGVEMRRGDARLALHPDSNVPLKVTSSGGLFRLSLHTPAEDLPPGGELKTVVAMTLGTAQAAPPAFDWAALPASGTKVEPLIVPDTPPADLPRTPLAAEQGQEGVCVHSTPSYLPLWAAAGVRWLRTGFRWAEAEPFEGRLDFSKTDALVESAEQKGMQIIALLMSNPSWASRDGKSTSPPKDLAAWARYVEIVVRRYKGRVHVWEVWNEPDIGEFWTGTAEDYVALLKSAYAAAKRADPACLVMSAGLDGPGEAFLQKILQLGAADRCDLIGFHPYAGTPEASEKRLRAVWRILNFYKVRKPVWVTEVGWQSGGWKQGPGVTPDEETKARYLTECYQRLRPLAEVICWYVDIEAGRMYGLARPSGEDGFECNPAYSAYKAMAKSSGKPLLKVDLPRSLAVSAGKPASLRATLTNTSGRALAPAVEVAGLPGKQVSVSMSSEAMPPGASREVEIALRPPPYLRAGKRSLVIAFFAERRLAAQAALDLEIANEGPAYEVGVTDGWVKRLDAGGKEISPLRPRTEFAFKPGDSFLQGAKVTNGGSVEETFRITFEGRAAGWCAFSDKPEVRVKPGKEVWTFFKVCVPAGAPAGSHSLTIVASSRTYPEVQAKKQIAIAVVAP